jgi:hypothetical protein
VSGFNDHRHALGFDVHEQTRLILVREQRPFPRTLGKRAKLRPNDGGGAAGAAGVLVFA